MKLENDCWAHYLTPDFSEAFLDEAEVQVHVEQPYPISKPLKSTSVDNIHKFHEDKESYLNQLLALRKDFHLIKERIIKQSFENSHATITKGLLNFCNTERYKAPFISDYNPFYGSGFLEHFTLNNNNYLVRPDCRNNLRINNVAKPWKNHKLILKTALDGHEHIKKISSKTTQSDILLLLQLEHELNLLTISDIDGIGDIKFNKKFRRLILDSEIDKSRLGVILFDTKFRLYDVETNKKIRLKDHSIDSAIKLEFIDHCNIALLTQNSLTIIDQRCKDHKLFKPELGECNRLCSLKINDNQVYLGSRHHLIRTDLRAFRNEEFCAHLMKTSPCYIDYCVDNKTKILCLSSQKYDEKVLFTGNPIGSLPFNVPSIHDTLTECRLKNDILLHDQLEERLQNSTCGLKLICDDSVDLYTANYFGDIFKQNISTTVEQNGVYSVNALYKWVRKLPESQKSLNLTNVVDMSTARFTLNKRMMEEHVMKFTKKSKKANLFLNHYNSIYNKRNLSSLAANFVAIWEDEEEREEVDLVPEVAPIDKVSSWIESSYFFE